MKKTSSFFVSLFTFFVTSTAPAVPVPTPGASPEIFFTSDLFPPANGAYISPGQSQANYANGAIIRNQRHHFFTQSFPPPAPGAVQIQTFTSRVEFEHSSDNGITFAKISAPAQVSVRVTFKDITGGSNTITRDYDTEMLQLDISGGSLPSGVMVRESPTLQSKGQTSIRTVPGGDMISSFFDIFTELSVDGGQTWSPAQQPSHVDLRIDPATIGSIPAGSPLLPPPDGQYVTPEQFHADYAHGIVIKDIRHRFFSNSLPPPIPGQINVYNFNSLVDMQLSTDSGKTFAPARVPAAATVQVSNLGSSGQDSLYDTEMLALNLQGGDLPTGVMIRESPTEPSRGLARIEAQTDETYRIGSFFDIFTELSIDGGQNWQPSTTGPAHLELERASAVLPFPTSDLPPGGGEYVTPEDWYALYGNGIVLSNLTYRRFTQAKPPPPSGQTLTETLGSSVNLQLSLDSGQSFNTYWAPASMVVQVRASATGGNTQYYDTEMLSLDIHGGTLPSGVMVRESPSKASLGRTSIMPDQTTGGYRISSFFDIFTEITLDGGQTWNATFSDAPIVSLVNQPPFAPFVVHCPSNITVFNGGPSGAAVNYTLPPILFYPDCPFGPFDATCVPPSGSFFPLGTTTVTCSGHDGCGERPSCTFQITVLRRFVVAPLAWIFAQAVLPPPNGIYLSPGLSNIVYANGMIIRNARIRAFTGGVEPAPFNPPSTSTFHSEVDLELSSDGGQTFRPAKAAADGSVRFTPIGFSEAVHDFDTELLQLDISGGTLPPGVMLRESPTLQSIGKTTVQVSNVGGGFRRITSFFDVFTELSLDGGQTWSPSDQPAPIELHSDPAAVTSITVATTLFPPPDGEYLTPDQFQAGYPGGIVIKDIRQSFFTQSFPPPPPGGDQTHSVDFKVDMQFSRDGGQTFRSVRVPGAMNLHVINLGSSGEDGLFETEMLDLNLQGGDLPPGSMIRESPTLPSRGGVSLQKQADGTFFMSSFFDIFTELSMDGGQTWQPSSTGPAHMELQKSVTPHLFSTPNLPPPAGQYVSPAQDKAIYPGGIMISNLSLRHFSFSQPPPLPGGANGSQFSAEVDLMLSLRNGQSWTRATSTGQVVVQVRSLTEVGPTRYFETEMLQLNSSGGGLPPGIMLRESPTKASLGRLTLTQDPASAQFKIDSFFDIFLELSLDGGQNWNSATTGPSHVGLTPSPLAPYTISCPGDITANATSSGGATVDYLVLIPIYPDCPFGPFTYDCAPPAGSVFPIGATTVNCVGSDGCGEHPTCSFTVTVRQPFTFSGIVLAALGNAVFQPILGGTGAPASSLIISNLSQSGRDGFRIDAGGADGVLVNFQPFPVLNQTCMVSVAKGPMDEVLSVVTFFGGPNSIVKADFSAVGSVESLVQVMDEHHQLIYSSRIDNNAAVSINQFFPNPCPNGPYFYSVYQDSANVWVRFCRAGCDCTGTNCFLERIVCVSGIILDRSILNLGSLEIRSQGVNNPSSLTVLNAQLMEFGNTHLAKGQATMAVDAAARRLPVNNLGSSGQDGVAIDLTRGGVNPGGGSQFDMSLDPVTLHNPGRCWKMTAFGQFNGIANTELGTASLTDGGGIPGGGCEVRVDFSAIGSSLARVDVYQGSSFVGSATMAAGVLGVLFEQGNLIACGKLPPPVPCFYARFDGPFSFQGSDGSQFSGTEIRILAAQPAGQVQNITSFCAQGCNLGSFTITDEQVPQPVEIDTFNYSLAQITLALPSGATETVTLSGPATVEVAIGPGGQAGDSDGNGLDDVTARMTKLDLQGTSSMGPVHLTLNPNQPSMGRIEETSNLVPGVLEVPPFAPGTADSFFDVFFEIQIGGPNGSTYFAAEPARMQTVITHKPPASGDNYVSPFTQPIDLLNANGGPSGIRLVREVLTPNPPVEIDELPSGSAQLTLRYSNGQTETVSLTGPTTIRVSIPADGSAADTDGDMLDQAPSEMLALDLQGASSKGPVEITLDPAHRSLGEIEEQVNTTPGILDVPPFCSTGVADSFFDVFLLIQVGGPNGPIYHPAQPVHMQAILHHKPPAPGDTYVSSITQPIDLLDVNGKPTGIRLMSEVHTPVQTNCIAITCSSNIVTWTCSADGTKVTYAVNATNTCGDKVNVICSPPSGSFFPVGVHSVTCTARDGQGNDVSCSFTVKVIRDAQPPRLACPNDLVVRTCLERELVSYNVSATDDCDPAPTVVCNPPSGSAFPLGSNLVNCIATDSCGHKTNCTFNVVLVPEPKPKLTITILTPGQQIQICWSTVCPGYHLQCARTLGTPILWENVTNVSAVVNGTNCGTLPLQSVPRFYRLIRYTPHEVFSTADTLPPIGSYNSPSDEQTVFAVPGLANGLIARWFVHRIPPPPCPPNCPIPPCATCSDPIIISFPTTLDVQYSMDGGKSFVNGSVSNITTRVQVHGSVNGSNGPIRSLDTEIISMDVSGGNLPRGVMVRESPTLASTGKHTIRTIDSGFMIGSFFDVFLEVSLDGSQHWTPSPTPVHLEYNGPVPENSFATDSFPPFGSYNSVSNVPSHYLNGLIARNFRNSAVPVPSAFRPPPCLGCPPDFYDFPTQLDFEVSSDGGQTFVSMSMTSDTGTTARQAEDTADTRLFDSELLSLRASPGPMLAGLRLRESPSKASTGKITVKKLANGGFLISSFFDVFTEVSLDNGQTWSAVIDPTHLELIP